MLKPIPTIFALCLCVLALTTAASTARAADDAQAKDKITLPAFHKQTVKIDGKDVPIEVRWFDKPFMIGSTDADTLPASVTKTWLTAFQALLGGKYQTFIDHSEDTKQAERFTDAVKKMPDKLRKRLVVEKTNRMKSVGEVRVGAYDLVVVEVRHMNHHDAAVVTHQPVFFVHHDDGDRMILMIAVARDRRDEMKQALAVGKLIQKKEIVPHAHKNHENQD